MLSSVLFTGIGLLSLLLSLHPSPAFGARGDTFEALDRLDEALGDELTEGRLSRRELQPILVVSLRALYRESESWFPAQALSSLQRRFGAQSLRICEACMRPQVELRGRTFEHRSGPLSLAELARLDEQLRGRSAPARSALWLEETGSGVSVRLVALDSGLILFAENIDPTLREYRGTARRFQQREMLQRRARGESLTHAFFDVGFYPGIHIDFEWADQWGSRNQHFGGFVFSFYDPIFGFGLSYHRAIEFQNALLGGQVIVSVPTALARAQTNGSSGGIDPLVSLVGMLRVPFGQSNYGGLLTVSTNGEVALGISLLNTTLLPLIP